MFVLRSVIAALSVTAVSAGCSLNALVDTAACILDMTETDATECAYWDEYLACYAGGCCAEYVDTVQALLDTTEADCTLACGGCFPATASIELPKGESKSMDQLTIGDKIHVGAGEYSEVYYFSTEMSETTSKFVELSTEKAALQLTPGHYLYVNGKLAQASSVQVGDELTLADGSKSAVVAVGTKWGPGLYNPHTMSGDIVVDGVLTSTYTDAVHPKLAHALLFPLRKMYESGLTFGAGFSAVTKGLPSWILEVIAA